MTPRPSRVMMRARMKSQTMTFAHILVRIMKVNLNPRFKDKKLGMY